MKTKLLFASIFFCLAAAGIATVFFFPRQFFQNPFEWNFSLEFPSFATQDSDKNFYVIDKSLSRIRKIAPDGALLFQIDGSDRNPGKFFYAEELATDSEGYLYVLNQVMQENGFYTEREEVLRYDQQGHFDRVVNSRKYKQDEITNNNVTRGRQLGLSISGKNVYWHELSDNGVIEFSINTDTWHLEQKVVLPINLSAVYVSSVIRVDDRTIVYSTKRGEIFRQVEGQNPEQLYSGDDHMENGNLSVPWWLGVDPNKRVIFSDLTRNEIRRIDSPNSISSILTNAQYKKKTQDPFAYVYYTFSTRPDGSLVTTNDISVLGLSSAGVLETVLTGGYFPMTLIAVRFGFWLGILFALATLVVVSLVVYQNLFKKRLSIIVKQLFILLPLVAFILGFVAYTLINFYSQRYEDQAYNHISQAVQVIAQEIDTERLEKIVHQKDFMDEDYQFIRRQLHTALNDNKDPWNSKFYFALHRIYRGQIYTMMYLNDGITTFQPYSYLNDPNNLYWKASNGAITASKASDPWGTWIYSVGPVYNKQGKVTALLEVGRDFYGFQHETNQMLQSMVPFVVGAFFALVLIFILFTWIFFGPLRTLRAGVGQVASGKWDTTLPIKGNDEVADITLVFNKMAAYIRNYIDEIIALSQGYRRFVPQEFLTHLQKDSVTEVQLGDQIQREMTIMFTDIRSFTSISESMSPKENFDFLNRYLSLVGPEVRKHQGFVDKYIGDAIMALFPNSSDDAIQTAVEIISLLHDFNVTQKERGLTEIHIGLGIHTGLLMLGILGEEERMDSTVISDNVNLASRLEGLTKFFDAAIIVSETSMRGVRNPDRYLFRYLGKVKVKGKKEPIGLYEVLDGLAAEVKNRKIKAQENLEAGIRHYQEKNFAQAQSELSKALQLSPDDTTVKVYLMMCKQALANPPTGEWTGAITMNSK